MSLAALRKAATMPPDELRFRVTCEARKWAGRVRAAVASPRWERGQLRHLIAADVSGSDCWSEVRTALSSHQYGAAQDALARHFATRRSALPLDARGVEGLAGEIRQVFPGAPQDARARADMIRRGRYDLLGYRALDFGSPPDWHADPVHGRRSPHAYWASVAYLNPEYGDHKVIWELNRHQHWLALGRAYALTGDAQYYREFTNQLASWLAANPPLTGTNWASMLEIGFRSLSWLWALEFFSIAAAHEAPAATAWLVDLLVAVDRQLMHVEHNLSHYFSPNTHLTGEALALYVAGHALPELAASARRANAGRVVLLREAERQVLGDGGHVELSTHYHRYSTDFFLLALAVARRSGDAAAGAFESAARRQAKYLRVITDDAGRRMPIGDDDGGQLFPICGRPSEDCADTLAVAAILLDDPSLLAAAVPEEAYWLCGADAARLRGNRPAAAPASAALPASGYYVSRTQHGDHLIFDAGRHGFLNGGHAHSDALAITLSVGGRPLLIDPGTATYTMDREIRDRFRSTAMHNTLVLDGRPQSEPRGPFHWGKRATAHAPIWCAGDACDYVEGTHDGYAPRRHIRGMLAIHGVGWWILDHVLGDGGSEIELFWHLPPAVEVTQPRSATAVLRDDNWTRGLASSVAMTLLDAGTHRLAAASTGYGRIEPAPVLRGAAAGPLPLSVASFIPSTAELTRGLVIESVAIRQEPGRGWKGTAFRARWSDGSMVALAAVPTEEGDARVSPSARWGAEGITTDARIAILVHRAGIAPEVVLVHGTVLSIDGAAPLIALPEAPPIVRRRGVAIVAPSVHEVAAATNGTD